MNEENGMLTGTTNDFATYTKTEYATVAGLLRFLVEKGHAKLLEAKRRTATGKGKPSSIYEVPKEVLIRF